MTGETIETIKNSLRALLSDAISASAKGSLAVNDLRGVALFNPIRDERFTSLGSFPAAVQIVTMFPNFAARFGNDNNTRLVLQFLYQYFHRIDAIKFDDTTFETLWQDFLFELIEEPDWLYRTVSNLRWFHTERSPDEVIDLGDGVTIRGRNSAEPKRPTENELSDFSRLWHDGCGKTIIEAQNVDQNHSSEV